MDWISRRMTFNKRSLSSILKLKGWNLKEQAKGYPILQALRLKS